MDRKGATFVHVTHEAAYKIGGIGAVLEGFFTSQKYLDKIERSIVIGPLFDCDEGVDKRLGENGNILYSSLDGQCDTDYAPAFQIIENLFNTKIVYGIKHFHDKENGTASDVEVLLFDVRFVNEHQVNGLKREMFERFGVKSDLYEHIWEYEQYVRLAPCALEALREIGAFQGETFMAAHEFMGMPSTLAAMIEPGIDVKTLFYAHEVATIRRIVEEHPGHDTMFYNVLERAKNEGAYVDDVFGSQEDYFKHPLVKASKYCDSICAVGHKAADELRFLDPELKQADIRVIYNGIPAFELDMQKKKHSRDLLCDYTFNLLGYRPDYIFTHVTRLVTSKGLWRDLSVLESLEKKFQQDGKTGVMFLLSTQSAQRSPADIMRMESDYQWPLAHREGHPDMTGGEADFYLEVQAFNAKSRNIKVVFINQFGFEQRFCGSKMPEQMEFMDIRKGCDVEFGQSVYEPFGIAHLEALSFGGICVISNICGCAGFVDDVTGGKGSRNVIVTDYTDIDNESEADPSLIDRQIRLKVEDKVSRQVAEELYQRLPKDEIQMQELMKSGYEAARNMSWDVVFENYLSKAMEAASCRKDIPSEVEYMYN